MLSKISVTRIITFLTLVFLSSGLLSLSASAVENHYCSLDADPLVCSRNNIIFTAPCGPTKSGGSGECGISVSGSTIEEKIWNGLTSFMTDEQAAGVLGNMAHEGGLSPARHEGSFLSSSPNFDIAANPKTSYGIGLIQWSFGRRVGLYKFFKEKGAEDLWTEYVDEGRSTYGGLQGKDFLSKAGDEVTDKMLNIELCYLKKELEENSQYSGVLEETTVQGAADYFLEKVEIPGNIEGTRPVRRESAQKYYDQFHSGGGVTANTTLTTAGSDSADTVSSSDSSASSSSSSSSDPSCNSCEKGSKNINGMAACLAHPFGADESVYKYPNGHPTEAFAKALPEVHPESKNWRPQRKAGASCEVFVSTVIRYSGYDPKFPTESHEKYIKNHPDLWEELPIDTDLQAGDVINGDGHISIIVQDEKGDFYTADAEHSGKKYGRISKKHLSGNKVKDNGISIWRATQANNSNVGVDVKNGVKTSSVTGSTSSTGQGNKDIGASALELAWPEGTPASTYQKKATDKFAEYFNTLPIAKEDARTKYAGGKSCDRFVATVLRYSGVDNEIPFGGPGNIRTYLENSSDWEEVQIEGQNSTKGLQHGDVMSWPGHVAIYAVDSNNKSYIVAASYKERFGLAQNGKDPSRYGSGGAWKAFRNKNNKSGGSGSCNACPNEDSDSAGISGLKDGGFKTVKEADEAVMKPYRNSSNKQLAKLGVTNGCGGWLGDNCTSFSRYFFNKYTNKRWTGPTGNGKDVSDYISKAMNMPTDKNPEEYAIFSGPSDIGTPEGHTGVILGIDVTRNKVIIGEAGYCSGKSFARAKEKDLSKYTSGKYTFVHLKDILKGELNSE